MAAGVCGAKENVRDGRSSGNTREPSFENGGNVLNGPRYRKRAAVEEHKNDRLAGGDDGFEQLLLIARQIEASARRTFAAHEARFPQCEDD
jgi:hypothetical protein